MGENYDDTVSIDEAASGTITLGGSVLSAAEEGILSPTML
jgi:hypothetical protein